MPHLISLLLVLLFGSPHHGPLHGKQGTGLDPWGKPVVDPVTTVTSNHTGS